MTETAATYEASTLGQQMRALRGEGTKRRDLRKEVRPDYQRQVWVNYPEAALILGTSEGYVRKLTFSGKVECRHRGAWKVSRLSLERYLAT
jgi:hypothetical protein